MSLKSFLLFILANSSFSYRTYLEIALCKSNMSISEKQMCTHQLKIFYVY